MTTTPAWSAKDEAFIKRYWGKKSTEEIADAVGRSTNAVQKKAQRLGMGYMNPFSDKPSTPKPAPKEAQKPAQKPLSKKETDAILHKATAPRPPTWEEAQGELKEAIEMCCHASANHPMTKQRCQMLLHAWNILDLMEKV